MGKIKAAKYFSITTDMWSSLAHHGYIAVTIHFINQNFEMENFLLDTREMLGSHTAENLAEELQAAVLNEWGLSSTNLAAVVTDNASNILCALSNLEWSNFGYFSHTLQLAVVEATSIPELSRALGRLVSHFHHSLNSSYLLKQKQLDLHVPQHSLVQEVSTRWNSSYYMVERVVEQQQLHFLSFVKEI